MDSISKRVEEIRKTSYELGFHDAKQISEQIYQKAFEDIRAEIQKLRNCSCSNSDGIVDDIEDIIDKHDPSKAEKERE